MPRAQAGTGLTYSPAQQRSHHPVAPRPGRQPQALARGKFARLLGVDAPLVRRRSYPIEYTPMRGMKGVLREIPVAPAMVGRAIVELELPADFLIILIARGDEFLLTSGGTVVMAGDTLLALTDEESFRQVQAQWGVHEVGTPSSTSPPLADEPA